MKYVFEPTILKEVVQDAVGLPLEQSFDHITAGLDQRYPGYLNTGTRRWIFNNAGGAMGQLALLYASLNEYLLFFGTPIGTEGHSGRYRTDVYDIMIDGEMWCYVEGELERKIYEPGDMAYLGKNAAKGYRVPDRAWMLEYARGPVYTMLPFGLADSALSTLDFKSLGRTLVDYTREATRSLRLRGNPAASKPIEAKPS